MMAVKRADRAAGQALLAPDEGRRLMLASIREKAFLQQARDLARTLGWRCYHTFDSRRSEPGFPDLIAVRRPRLVVAELKTERGELTPAQGAWLEEWRGVPGAEVFCWRPSDWPEIEAVLA